MFKIEALQPTLNRLPFEAIELPDLTILVGINGSGKTQLLKGIMEGRVNVYIPGCAENITNLNTTLLENGSSELQGINTPAATNIRRATQVLQKADLFKSFRRTMLYPIVESVRSINTLRFDEVLTLDNFWLHTPEKIFDILNEKGNYIQQQQIFDKFNEARDALTVQRFLRETHGSLLNHAGLEIFPGIIRRVVGHTGKDPLSITSRDIEDVDAWGGFGLFDPLINHMISAYRDARARNDIELGAQNRGIDASYLSNEEFLVEYGPEPWVEISRLLEAFGLPYRVKEPPHRLDEDYMFTLEHKVNNGLVIYTSLSSGEKILVRFALSLFKFHPTRVSLKTPRLLLLDEMDASLHPEMLHRWLNTIQNSIVGQMHIKCIMTTHSPTTVALAPEGSIYEMSASAAGPHKITKQQALNKLTYGLPSLSIDYESRRQVFVESRTDAVVYDIIANLVKADIGLKRTLTFMTTGPSSEKQERNTGCTIVEHIVDELIKHGNKSVFGILDWDLKHKNANRIKVIGQNTHYALDNILMNPLLIGILMLRQFGSVQNTNVRMSDIPTLTNDQAQNLANAVQHQIKYPKGAPTGSIPVRFIGGNRVETFRAFAETKGHTMEAAIAEAFPPLRRYHPDVPGNLNKAVVDFVLTDWRKFTPSLVAEVLIEIADQDID